MYRIGKKQKRAILTEDGKEVVVFPKGKEILAAKVCRLLNHDAANAGDIPHKFPEGCKYYLKCKTGERPWKGGSCCIDWGKKRGILK